MRYRRPIGITLVAVAYFLSPLINLIQAAVRSDVSIGAAWTNAVKGFGIVGIILILAAPLVGIAIYSGRKWGFYVFLAHAVAVLGSNFWTVFAEAKAATLQLVAMNAVVFAVAFYLLRKDLRAPYLAAGPRGWRLNPRVPCDVDAKLSFGGKLFDGRVENVSTKSALVRCAARGIAVDDEGDLSLRFGDKEIRVKARVVRVNDDSVVVSMEDLGPDQQDQLVERAKRKEEGP